MNQVKTAAEIPGTTTEVAPEIQVNVVLKPKPGLSIIDSNKQLLDVLGKLEGWDVVGITIGPKRQPQVQQELPPRLPITVGAMGRRLQ